MHWVKSQVAQRLNAGYYHLRRQQSVVQRLQRICHPHQWQAAVTLVADAFQGMLLWTSLSGFIRSVYWFQLQAAGLSVTILFLAYLLLPGELSHSYAVEQVPDTCAWFKMMGRWRKNSQWMLLSNFYYFIERFIASSHQCTCFGLGSSTILQPLPLHSLPYIPLPHCALVSASPSLPCLFTLIADPWCRCYPRQG